MKITTFLAFFLYLIPGAFAQDHIYYDAKFIRENCIDGAGQFGRTEELKRVLAPYYSDIAINGKADLLSNPFFKPHVPDGFSMSIMNGRFVANGISSIGGINVTNFADGLAKFLVKRFKEELTITFFQKLQEELDDPNYAELSILFPSTKKVLKTVGKDIYVINAYINSLREAFIKDLAVLYTNLKTVKDTKRVSDYFKKYPELGTIVKTAFYLIDQYQSGTHPGDVLAGYDEESMLTLDDPDVQQNARSTVKVLKLFSRSIRSSADDHYWVPVDSLKMQMKDPIFRDIYFGLIYAKSDGISFNNAGAAITFQSILKKAREEDIKKIEPFADQVQKIALDAETVNEAISVIKDKKKSEISPSDYYNLFSSSLDILDDGFILLEIDAMPISPDVKEKLETFRSKWLTAARSTGELYVDIKAQNYSSAIVNTVAILDIVWEKDKFNEKVTKAILKYGNLAAVVAEAKSSDEVEAAIEAVALPSGSARIKRETGVNISLNAFVGGFVGNETLPTLKKNKSSLTAGFAAPVGVAFSWGNIKFTGKDKEGGKSISLFVPLIDVGALATYRLNDDSTKVASEIQLKNIISPGLYVYFGFGKCPLSLGIGAQVGPQLREVTAQDVNIEKNFYIRYGATLVVDIPLLNIYSKSKKE